MRKRYVYIAGEAHEVSEDYQSEPRQSGPIVMGDIQPYKSVVTGEVVGGRRQHREHLRAHNLVEIGNEKVKPKPMPDVPGRREALIETCKRLGVRGFR